MLLVLLGLGVVTILSMPLAETMGLPRGYYLMRHLGGILLGIVIVWVLHRWGSRRWFDPFGTMVLAAGVAGVLTVSFWPGIHADRNTLLVSGYAFDAALFFLIGVVWLIDFGERIEMPKYRIALSGVWLVLVPIWFLLTVHDPVMGILIGLVMIGMAISIEGSFRKVMFLVVGVLGVAVWIVVSSHHRLERIQVWWNALIHHVAFRMPTGLDLMYARIHEGLFFMNDWGGGLLIGVTVLYVWLILLLRREAHLFARGVAMILSLVLLLHIASYFQMIPLRAPYLWMVEYGFSGMVIAFVMMGMVMLRRDRVNTLRR